MDALIQDVRYALRTLGMAVAGIGGPLGIAAALLLSRVMGAILYQVEPTDPPTFVVGTLALGLVALVASYLPARRATRVDPLSALRHE